MERNILFTQIPIDELKDIISICIRNELQKNAKDKDTSSEELIKITDAVKLLGVSKVTIYKWREKGILPFYRISSRIYFKKSELMEVLNSSNKYKR